MNTQEVSKSTEWQIHENINKFDIDNIVKDVISFKDQWYLDESRQNGTPTHKDTQMYQVRFLSYDWEPGIDPEPIDVNHFSNDLAKKEFDQMCKYLEDFYNSKVVRVEIINMKPNSNIPPHVDSSTMLYLARRVHVPLVSNKNVFFTVFNKTINMEVGKWYEINNYLPHSVKNNSDQDRIHAIIDLLPNKYFKEQ
ncbi:Aspartyl/asparaginy/proline hydroxylase [uncultured Caudovirales phage]|uniref:Aspartyl/asparaginy/proline hydroxylase n=1 Tax=uncultured Caudovirales phage TaxID=2100421 RepID=A0A6J7WN52_9CAUD|nr:Aspartyl/asparaginy/proline hydroxylase [uncultured Caudovirales phage]